MEKYKFLAFDFGASSGRAMLATFENGKIKLEEKHRFSNDPVTVNGGMYWDILRLFHEIKQGILKCVNSKDADIRSIGIDTWGVDYGLLDKDDKLISNPYHYRDLRTEKMCEAAFEKVSKEEIFKETGIAFNNFNTVYQLLSEALSQSSALKEAKTLLFIPDLLNFFLTGEKKTEYTIASTSQLLNAENRTWAKDFFKKLEIPADIFTDIINPGEKIGVLRKELAEELGTDKIPVVSVASHDTASAVVSVPVEEKDFIYISSGTWSLMGVELSKPIISEEAMNCNFTNEGGAENTVRFLKNIMGLWLIQESRRQWEREGELLGFDELEKQAAAAKPFRSLIDPDYAMFAAPGNMPKKIREYCKKTNQPVPETKGEVIRCIAESLALCYRCTAENMEKVTGRKYSAINIVGGGIKDKMLCRFTANATGKIVKAGPVEATSIGNVIVQAIAAGAIKNISEGRKAVKESFPIEIYEPEDSEAWNEAYEKWRKITGR